MMGWVLVAQIAKKKLDSELDSYFEKKKGEAETKESTEAPEVAQ